jgi:phenylalanyl-tRNA synthetase beta chain
VDAVERVGAETVLDLDITTNRVDCMNVLGIAREVAVLYQLPLRQPELAFPEEGEPAAAALSVEIQAPDLCPRFCARLLEVLVAPSPAWLRDRLELVGVRSINNVVDLTNYVMLELGQPSHAFDLDRVPEGRLVVRWARDGETLETLDGVERRLGARAGVVAGPQAPLALAGVMGGAASEVSDETRRVALEAACWEPLAIRRSAKALGMHTEASHRFERGADPEGPPPATARIAHLLHKIGAGRVRPGLIDRCAAPVPRRTVVYRHARAEALLGVSVPPDEVPRILGGLGFQLQDWDGHRATAQVPTWRGDVAREVDVIEEVARHHGLAHIPPTIPASSGIEGLRPWQQREREVRRLLAGAGLAELIQHVFVADTPASVPARVAIENPISDERGTLRNALVWPGLVDGLEANLRIGRRDVRIFELGTVFLPGGERPVEERRLGLLLSGAAAPPHWSAQPRRADFYDVKGLLEAVWARLGAEDLDFTSEGAPALLHPERSASVRWRGRVVGYAGALHPELMRARELRDEVIVGEVALDALLADKPAAERFAALPRQPAVTRDLSILCGRDTSYRGLEQRIRTAAGGLLAGVTVVDRYDRPPIPDDQLSLTVALRFQDPARTLTGQEVQASIARIVQALRDAGAEIRGE